MNSTITIKKDLRLIACSVAALLASTTMMFAVTTQTWMGLGATAAWNVSANWSAGPFANNNDVLFNTSSTANLTQTLGQSYTAGAITLSGNPMPITINNDGNVLTVSNIFMSMASADLTILENITPKALAPSFVTIGTGRTLTISNMTASAAGWSGPGTLVVLGANSEIQDLSNNITMVLNGGTCKSSVPVRLSAMLPNELVTLIITNNGTLNYLTGAAGPYKINLGALGVGSNILTMASGNIFYGLSGNAANADGISVGQNSGCTGIFNLNGGTIILTNRPGLASNVLTGESFLSIPGTSGAFGTVNLNGGTLTVPVIFAPSLASGSGTLNFNGTVVIANRNNTAWISGIQNAYVTNGGAVFNTAGNNVTISQNLLAPPSGLCGGLTNLDSVGGGILTLSGINTYTGTTMVSSGTLAVSPASISSASPIIVADNATLALTTPTVGATMNTSSLTVGTVSAGATLVFNPVYGNPSAPFINATSLTLNGPLNVTFNGYGLTVGQFTLVKYSGSLGGSYSAGTLTLLPGITGTLVNTGKSIDLQITAVLDITSAVQSDGNIIFNGANGPANGAFNVLTSTDIMSPLTNWTIISSGSFSPSGTFSATVPISVGGPPTFFVVEVAP